jgi:hypothetical protein
MIALMSSSSEIAPLLIMDLLVDVGAGLSPLVECFYLAIRSGKLPSFLGMLRRPNLDLTQHTDDGVNFLLGRPR